MGELKISKCDHKADEILDYNSYMVNVLDTLYRYAHYEYVDSYGSHGDIIIRIPQTNENDYNLILEWLEDFLNK